MKEQIQKKLNDSKVLRWSVLALVAFTMLCGYFLTDVMSPLKPMLEKELLWDSLDYGIFTSAYGWFNVFAFMLIIGGIILDKMGVRFPVMDSIPVCRLGISAFYSHLQFQADFDIDRSNDRRNRFFCHVRYLSG